MSDQHSRPLGEVTGYLKAFVDRQHVSGQNSAAYLWREFARAARDLMDAISTRTDLVREREWLAGIAHIADQGAAMEDRLFSAGHPTSMRHVRRDRERHAAKLEKHAKSEGWIELPN